jgi:heptosyltransferase-2
LTAQKTIPLIPLKEDAHILVRGVNWLGDAVMSTSALIRLREALPKARISLLAPAKLADLWSGQSFLDEVIAFQKSDGVGGVSKKLRGRFDVALIFPNSFRSALEAWLAGIKLRAGYGAPGRSALLTHVIPRRLEEVPTRKKSISEIRRLIAETPPRGRETYPASAHQIDAYRFLPGR